MAANPAPVTTPEYQSEVFLESLERCTNKKGFFDAFYTYFFSANPAVKEKFAATDFPGQNNMLEKSLRLAAVSMLGDPIGEEELQKRAVSHDAKHMDIAPELYHYWFDAILKTASEFDVNWNAEVEQSWRVVMDHAIDVITAGYDR